MRQQFVALFGSSIKAHRVINLVIRAERHLLVATVDGGRACINKMLHRIVAACFQNIIEADDVGLDIAVRVVDGISYTSLCSKIHDHIKVMGFE